MRIPTASCNSSWAPAVPRFAASAVRSRPTASCGTASTHGILKLTLREDGYDWQFVPIAGGTFTDSGSGGCHLSCPAGYELVGNTCVDINECLTNNGGCDPLTTCTNTPGRPHLRPVPDRLHRHRRDRLRGSPASPASWSGGRPTTSVTINVIADRAVEAYFEYGTAPGVYTGSRPPPPLLPTGSSKP